MFGLHITFDDGSNPWYRFNMTAKEFGEELVKWSKDWILMFDTSRSDPQISCMIFMTATKRKTLKAPLIDQFTPAYA